MLYISLHDIKRTFFLSTISTCTILSSKGYKLYSHGIKRPKYTTCLTQRDFSIICLINENYSYVMLQEKYGIWSSWCWNQDISELRSIFQIRYIRCDMKSWNLYFNDLRMNILNSSDSLSKLSYLPIWTATYYSTMNEKFRLSFE